MSARVETKEAGSSLTAIAEYTETAMALATLRQQYQGVVYDVTVPKEMKAAKEGRAELRTLRTTLEKTRKEIKAPALERCRLIDDEAKRITAELVALEEPIDVQIKAEEARAEAERLEKLEAERLRVEAVQQKIQAIRDVPSSLLGKPSVIIAGQLAKLQATVLDEDEMGADYITATDALTAAIANVERLLAAQKETEAEQARVKAEREELKRMREENARLQREAEARAEADRLERERVAQIERDRVAAEEREALQQAERERIAREEETRKERERMEAIERAEHERAQAEQEAALQAERERQAAEQKKLDEQAAKLKREQQAAMAEAERVRLAGLGLREAAQVVVDYFDNNLEPAIHVASKFVADLSVALANDAAPAKPARAKRVARA